MTEAVEALKDYIEKQERTIAELNGKILLLETKRQSALKHLLAFKDVRYSDQLEFAIAILESE